MNLVHAALEPSGPGPHPTLIALHGWGANALDLLGLAPHLAGGRFLVLCPQGDVTVPIAPQLNGYGWFPITMGTPPDPASVERALDSLEVFVEEAGRRYPIEQRKLALLGFSQGGVMAYALTLKAPKRFAALAALSSWLPPMLAERYGAGTLDQLPVLVQHGTRDELIEPSRGRSSVEALRELRASVIYREYEMGHEINAASLADLSGFLQEKVISPIVAP
jgi:phospholipase/carboxylesterase